MKRFLLFSGKTYYAGGGAFDLRDSFDTLDEALAGAEKEMQIPHTDWWHVCDQETDIIEAQSETQAHS